MGARSISAKQLRADCTVLERAVLSARMATKESLAPHRPGGSDNPQRGADGWLAYFRHLHRIHALGGHSFGGTASGRGAASHEAADAAVLDALRSKPVMVVNLASRDASHPPIYVYAKSVDALLHIHALDRQLAYMTDIHSRLLQVKGAEAMELLPRVMSEIAYTYHLLCWIVTYDQPGMPYRADDPHPEPPDSIKALEPWEVIRICEAHHKHLLRLHFVSALIDDRKQTEEGGHRPSWSMFIADAAEVFGEPPEIVIRDRALASTLAAMQLSAASKAPRAAEGA